MSVKSELRVNRSREVPNRVRLVDIKVKREFASTTKTVTLILVVKFVPRQDSWNMFEALVVFA
jgi:hypothetical protein